MYSSVLHCSFTDLTSIEDKFCAFSQTFSYNHQILQRRAGEENIVRIKGVQCNPFNQDTLNEETSLIKTHFLSQVYILEKFHCIQVSLHILQGHQQKH